MPGKRIPAATLDRRALNRALLARQFLLERTDISTNNAIEFLIGMQAQSPLAPYVGLWARLKTFDPADLSTLIEERQAVRMTLMRTTIHLVSATDATALRPLIEPVIERGWRNGPFSKKLPGVDLDALLTAGRKLLTKTPMSGVQLAEQLARRWPDRDAESMSQAVRLLVASVQVPPRGIWGKGGQAMWTPVSTWLGKQAKSRMKPEDLVLRYLSSFGPAGVMDFQAWSWLTRQAPVFEKLRRRLVTFRDENGRELFDLPDALRPSGDVPAPVRFIPEYDNLLLSHADRGRVVTYEDGKRVFSRGGLLIDGFVAGAWRITRAKSAAALEVERFRKLSRRETQAVETEAEALLDFVANGAKSRSLHYV